MCTAVDSQPRIQEDDHDDVGARHDLPNREYVCTVRNTDGYRSVGTIVWRAAPETSKTTHAHAGDAISEE